jgi:hypothetical protein
MPRDPYIREKYTREVKTARAVACDYFERFQGSIQNLCGKLAAPAVRQLRIHDDAAAGAEGIRDDQIEPTGPGILRSPARTG